MNMSLRVGQKVNSFGMSLQNAEEVLDCLRAPSIAAQWLTAARPHGIS